MTAIVEPKICNRSVSESVACAELAAALCPDDATERRVVCTFSACHFTVNVRRGPGMPELAPVTSAGIHAGFDHHQL